MDQRGSVTRIPGNKIKSDSIGNGANDMIDCYSVTEGAAKLQHSPFLID